MAFMKVIKNKAYFKRFQVKFKRRRAGKTDYRQRKGLIIQDKNKYATPKYRLVVRFSNKNITCQIVYATLTHDVVVASAYSKELPEYGLNFGLTNYAAAYCTGLLIARRVLTKLGLADTYKGLAEASGEDYMVEEVDDAPRPFFCLLDVGLKRTSTGSKVFAALKGALDGGLDIPHSEKRYVGYDEDSKRLDEDFLRKYIFGGHVGEYMDQMKEEDADAYAKHFSGFIKEGITSDKLEGIYKKVHAAIRAKPVKTKKAKTKPASSKKWQAVKKTYEQRKADLAKRIAAIKAE
uniref:Large ribosomal subunit protein uL18 C-terminal eukaryotes domain-containing protein n=1 Tax=Chloropicon laureae TaxID=464258 RepID=A0A7S3DYN6_9CHLO|mmetsp:Transcript_10483/g.26927  ORF Transcript_10483/g.26927 Transcript_10483/m.26927 type:complete len:292 (+) Transcript_10483:84-959(+)|eukprot:CAMPEP_0197495794 /NCGR_PEP_ID=MMETSP1311-20131121/38794_1 /TAXON_ID=464262 /ORGANISM="Genus nov. species nov., Strain RCC856" /LENGTH=291 /DNA_ID=CAMNT_0043041323 /DNA_START=28 /DNA_END=903 /DNA_ORIENTATION=-